MKKYICELVGTFFLVFSGTGAIIANDIYGGVIGHVGVSLSFGLVVMAVIYSFGDSSGAHINPAVTLGFYQAKRMPLNDTINYIIFQILGAILASVLLSFVFPTHLTLGHTVPGTTIMGACIYEFLLTYLLMMVILSVATGSKEKGLMAGVAIGGVVALEALFAGPVTGASMNPARSIGPALISGQVEHLWLYIVCPILGALAATVSCKYFHVNNCCAPETP